jgi:hypothetical protein
MRVKKKKNGRNEIWDQVLILYPKSFIHTPRVLVVEYSIVKTDLKMASLFNPF